MVTGIEKERIPFEHHDETDRHHRIEYECIPDPHQGPPPKRQRLEYQNEECARDRQDPQYLDDAGLRIALRRKRLRVEEPAEEMAHELPVHREVDAVISPVVPKPAPRATAPPVFCGASPHRCRK